MNTSSFIPCKLGLIAAVFSSLAASTASLPAQMTPPPRQSAVNDWSHHHLLTPSTRDLARLIAVERDQRFLNNWYNHHPETWWAGREADREKRSKQVERDWNTPLGAVTFEPIFDFVAYVAGETGIGSLTVTDLLNGTYIATSGNVSGLPGSFALYPGVSPASPGPKPSPSGSFTYDNLIAPNGSEIVDTHGGLFTNSSGQEINIAYSSPSAYNFSLYTPGFGIGSGTGSLAIYTAPGGGETFPAKYVFDVTAAPSCSKDFVVMGLPANAVSGGQANIVAYNNLYTTSGTPAGLCPGTGPTVVFAYASGTGLVPGNVSLSLDGTQIAFVEDRQTGSSYFHVLTLGTTGANGSSVTAAAVPGTGNNAKDSSVLLSPDLGITNQTSTASPFVNYAAHTAYATTYNVQTQTGYIYKISNVFSSTPAIAWHVALNAIPSSPVYDSVSNEVFFTDSNGRIDFILDSGALPSVTYGSTLAIGATSQNPVTVDSTNGMVYATFNTNGTNALVVQTSTSFTNTVTVPVGTGTKVFTGPYDVDFNNAFYTGSAKPILYAAGTGSGTTPTLYGIGFSGSSLNPASVSSTPLATGMADASPVTEFYNLATATDSLFVGVSNHCAATTGGGTAGCVLALNITSGFPTVTASTTAIPATGGATGIVVDNDSTSSQASSIYYGTKTGATLVKATQSALQ